MTNPNRAQPDELSTADPRSDAELVQRAQANADEFAALYQRYHREIEQFVRGRVSDTHQAEDITSKVFLKALHGLPRFTDGPFRAWLYRIARNTIIDEYRRARPGKPLDEVPLIDSAPQPDEIVASNDAAARLHAALGHLKPAQAEIIRLRLHGLSIAEIGRRLNMSENAVKSAQRRAFIALKSIPGVRP